MHGTGVVQHRNSMASASVYDEEDGEQRGKKKEEKKQRQGGGDQEQEQEQEQWLWQQRNTTARLDHWLGQGKDGTEKIVDR